MRALGIDLGTCNTAAMLHAPDGRIRPLLFDGSPLTPTAVFLAPDGRLLVGRDAQRQSRTDPGRFEPHPKRRVDDGVVLLGGAEVPVTRLFAAVLREIAAEARRQLGRVPEQVRLTHPARWAQRRRQILTDAARMAGLGTPQLVPEPVAAASYFTAVLRTAVPTGRCLAIYDLGGGTFDAAVVRRTPAGFDVLAEDGLADVGGLDFDHAIVEYLGRAHGERDQATWARLITPGDDEARRARRDLYEEVRAAKEMLSRTTSADLHLPLLESDAHLTRVELEDLVRPYLERTVACLSRTITAAGLAPTDLVGIFLVGGSSRIPAASAMIHRELRVAPTTLEQPETVVVEGALCLGGAATQAGGAPHPPATPASGPPTPPRPAPPVARPVSPPPAAPRPVTAPRPAPMPPRMVPPARPVPAPARPVPPPARPAMTPPPTTPVPARPVAPTPPRIVPPARPVVAARPVVPAPSRSLDPIKVATALVGAAVAIMMIVLIIVAAL